MFIGLAILLLSLTILINIVDYSIYTYKRNNISKAMDYAVTAAVQQLSNDESRAGLASGFLEETGQKSLENIKIDIDTATKILLSIMGENSKLDDLNINSNLLVCTTYTNNNTLNYIIKVNQGDVYQGTVNIPSQLEDRINQVIDQYWSASEDNSKVHINQNPDTNMLENGTYLFAFLNEIKISGIYSQRTVSLAALAGAKVERG